MLTIRRVFLLVFIACCAVSGTQAIPAYPHRVKFFSGKDSFFLTLCGDENYKFAITDDGYTALPDSCGWFYATTNQTGEVIKSEYMVCSENMKSRDIKSFLSKQLKGILPSYPTNEETKRLISYNSSIRQSSSPVVGTRRVLIILMQYNDLKFKKTQRDFDRLFNEIGYHDDGAYGSVYDYYDKVSYGQLQLKCDVVGPYTASKNMSYYGGNTGRSGGDMNPKALFDEAIRFAMREVNLSNYDSDGDGYVDNVHIIFAGYGEEAGANANTIWSHEMSFPYESFNGVKIDRYSCSPELRGKSGNGISRIGAPCHEIGHALGAMDYYDVNYQTGGYYEGTGEWDVMAGGSWNDNGARPADFNPYVKAYNFGWIDVKNLDEDTVNIISPSTNRNNIYRVDTPVAGDYFLLENRNSKGINSAEPGSGLLIFHIGPQLSQRERTNTINASFPLQCYIVCASAKEARPRANSSSYGSINTAGCPYPGTTLNTNFTKNSIPSAFCINGMYSGISLTNITELENGDISLYYSKTKNDGDVNPPDEPTEEPDEDEVEGGEIVWSDDFEVMNRIHVSNWTSETLFGKGYWTVNTYTSTPSDREPIAISGLHYMCMEQENSGVIMGLSSRYSCRIISDKIDLNAGEYVLTGKYGGYSTSKKSNDTIYVEIMTEAIDSWVSTKTLLIQKPKQWYSFILPIKFTSDCEIKISFKGNADDKSLLYLDDLRIYRLTTDVEEMAMEDNSGYVYTINGLKIEDSKTELQNLTKGVYLIYQGNTVHKLYVK